MVKRILLCIPILLITCFSLVGCIPSDYDMSPEDIKSNPAYLNMVWKGSDYELQQTTKEVNEKYFETHTYIKGETDCNDMAIDIWNMLKTEGITSIIAIGNLDLDRESFDQCDHAWLLIFCSGGGSFALEATNGEVYFNDDVRLYPQLEQYWEGFFYVKPSDLRADIGERW